MWMISVPWCSQKSEQHLRHLTRGILQGIESKFPEGISIKKLEQEGIWNVKKELLGWMFNGIERTIQLPAEKLNKLATMITTALRQGCITHKNLQKLHGKLRHVNIAMPWANGLLSPGNEALGKDVRIHNIKPKNMMRQTLEESLVMARIVSKEPTKAALSVPKKTDVIIFTDASIEGICGIIYCAHGTHSPLVFRMPFPGDIKQSIINTMK